MAGPWEKFQTPAAPEAAGPWQKFATPAPAAAAPAAPAPVETVDVPAYDAMGNPTGTSVAAPVKVPDMSYGEQMGKIGKSVDDTVRLLATGATFGLADKFAGGMNALTGSAPSYDAGVKAERARTQKIRDDAPISSAIIEGVGGVGSGLGLASAGLTTAGRMGSGLLGRTLGFGAEGAAYGAASGAGNTYSSDWRDYAKNSADGASLGVLIGGGLPLAGSAASSLYRGAKALTGPTVEGAGRGASVLLKSAAQADEAGLRGLGNLGDAAMLPDAGPSMLGLAQGAGTGAGPGKTALVTALRERDAQTGPRLAAVLDDALGPAPVPSRVETGIREAQRALSPDYEAALDAARAVTRPAPSGVPHWGFTAPEQGIPRTAAAGPDIRPLADALDAQIVDARGPVRSALESARNMLNLYGTRELDPSPRALLQTRHALDGMIGEADRAGNTTVVRALSGARQQVDDVLGEAVPGIKRVDAQFAELARQREALERGAAVLDGGKTAIRPVELADEITAGALPQGLMVGPSAAPLRMRQGARADIDRLVGTNVNDLNVLERTFATPRDWNSGKLGQLFGDEARDTVAAAIEAERRMRGSYQNIVQGSQTAQRQVNARALDGTPMSSPDTTLTGLGMTAVTGVMRALSGMSRDATRDQIATIMSSQGPEVQRVVSQLLAEARRSNDNAAFIRRLIADPNYLRASAPASGRE